MSAADRLRKANRDTVVCVQIEHIEAVENKNMMHTLHTNRLIWNVIRAFAVREGLRRDDDTLPKRFLSEPIPDGPSKGMVMNTEVLEKLKDEYYTLRGWDAATGIPLPDKLYALDLPDIAEDMRTILSSGKGA